MSDLFETFVFDLQRFDEGTYGSILTLNEGDVPVEDGTYWSETAGDGKRALHLYMDDTATNYADEATITYTTEDKYVDIPYTDPVKIKVVTEVTKVTPTDEMTILLFNANAGTDGSTTLQFVNGSGNMYFDVAKGEDDSVAPSAVHFMGSGDELVLTDDTVSTFKGEQLYIGADTQFESVLPTFDLSGVAGDENKTLKLTSSTDEAKFEISSLAANDNIVLNDDITITIDGAEEAGVVAFTAVANQTSPNLEFTVSDGGSVAVNGADNGIKGMDVVINGITVNLGTTDFTYTRTGSEGFLALNDIEFGEDATEETENASRTFKIGESFSLSVIGMSNEGSAFIVNEDDSTATGFVFSTADQKMSVIVTEDNPLPDDFGFYTVPANDDDEGDDPGIYDLADSYTKLAIPTVTGTYAITKDDDVYSIIVGNGTVSDENTTLTISGLEDNFVKIVFDDSGILGVIPSDTAINIEDSDDEQVITLTEIADPGFSSGMEINVVDAEYSDFADDAQKGLKFGTTTNFEDASLVSIDSGKYVYKYVADDNIGITLTDDDGEETVYALDKATALHPMEGGGAITDATDGDDNADNDPTYGFVNASGSAYFKVNQQAWEGEHQLRAFVFGGESDVIGREAYNEDDPGLSLAYLDHNNVEQTIEGAPLVDANHFVTMTHKPTEEDDPANFAVYGFSKADTKVYTNFSDESAAEFIFGASAPGNELGFDEKGGAYGISATSTVTMNAEAAALLAHDEEADPFQINGEDVDITANLAGDSLVFNANDNGEQSLLGLGDGSKVDNAGGITKIYGASGVNNQLTVGGTSYTYTANGSSAADLAYFTVDGTSATKFTFAIDGDALKVKGEMTEGGFSLADKDEGAIDTPSVYDSEGAAKDEYTLTKIAGTTYGMSGFEEGDFAEIGSGSVAFETLADGSSAAITFDAKTAEVGGVSYLVEGDAVKVNGISTPISFDGDTVEILTDSYTYNKTGEDTSAITDLYASDYPTTIKQLGGASYVQTAGGESGAGEFFFVQSNQSFVAGPAEDADDEDADGVRFVIKNDGVSAIEDVSDKEFVFGETAAFAGVSQVNGKSFDVTGASYLQFFGNENSNRVSQLIAFDGEDVVVNDAAGASYVGAREVDSITFVDNTFEISGTSGTSRGVLFIVDDELTVSGLSHVGANGSNESVTGGFSTVTNINGKNFAVTNDDEIMVVGNDEPGITKIAKVSDGAELENVGGASQAITDTEGVFTFAGNSFLVLGDSSVTFQMDTNAAASVAGITNFAQNGESLAVVAGKLNGLYINAEDKTIDVEGDADDILAYVKDTYEGETLYGLAVGGSAVTVNNAASATFIEAGSDGKYTFAMDKDADPITYTVGGDSEVIFELEGNKAVGIYDMEKGASVTGDFSNVTYVEGISSTGEVLEEGFVQITGDSSVTVVYDEFEVRELSNGASISSATTFKHAYTDEDTNAITVTDASGDEFTVEGDPDGVHYLLNGKGEIVGVDDLDEGATLSGSLGALSSVNGKDFDVKEEILNYGGLSAGDGQFAIVGASSGIGAIVELGGKVTVTDGGGASKFATNDNIFITSGGDQYIVAGLKEVSPEQFEAITPSTVPAEIIAQIAPYITKSDGVEFVTDGEDNVTAINGLSGNELIASKALADAKINGQQLAVTGASMIVAQGTDDEDGISALVIGSGSNVLVTETAGASAVLAIDVDTITFGESSTFKIDSTKDYPAVGFALSGINVNRIGFIDNEESVTGNFNDISSVNGADFDVTDSNEIMVVGNEDVDGLTKVVNVSDSAVIANVAGASQVITDTDGTFTFTNSNQKFEVHEIDESTVFDMNGNDVANVNLDFGVVISDNSNFANVSVNGAKVDITGDENDMVIGALSSDGIVLVANLGSASGVTVNNAGGASFIGTDKEGTFTFTNDGRAFDVAGDSQVVFVLDEDENVTAVIGANKGTSIVGDYSKAVAFAGLSSETATEFTTATVQIAGDEDVMVVHDAFEVHMLSNGASISSATTVEKAYTDSANLQALTVTDASGDEFTVYGDADGVMYSLDAGEIVAVEGLDEGATLSGNLSEIKSINGVKFDIVESKESVSLHSGDEQFSVVGAKEGISEVVGLSGFVTVLDNGGASVLRADGNIMLVNAAGSASQLFIAAAAEPTSTVLSASDGVNFFLTADSVTAIDNIDSDEAVLSYGSFEGVTKLNNKDFNVINDSDALVVLGKDGNNGINAVLGVGNTDGATVKAAAGASFVLSDSEGAITFGTGSAADTFTLATDASSIDVGFNINDSVAVESIDYVNREETVFGKFSDGRIVNGDSVKATDDVDNVIGVRGSQSYAGVSELYVQANATVTAWGSATSVNAMNAGSYVFIGADNATQTFTAADTTDSLLTFVTDKNRVTGVEELSDGYIRFDPNETGSASLDVNIAHIPGQTMTFASTDKVSLTVDPYEVVIVEGVNGSVSGVVGAETPATVIGPDGVTSLNVNGKEIFVDDDNDQFNVVVHDTAPDYLYNVDGDATVIASDVSVRANSAGTDTNPTKDTFVIAGESYVFDDSKDENDGFTFVTDSNGVMNKVASLEGALVINDGNWDGNINGDDFSVADSGTNSLPVTVNSGASGIESVGGLEDGDSVAGDIGAAQVHIPGYGEEGGNYPGTTITINGKPYTVVRDSDGVDVTGDNADVITDLDNQASLIGAEGSVTVNGTELEPEEGDVIKGDRDDNSHARIVGDDELIRQATAINHYNHQGYDVDTEETTAAAFNIEDVVGLPVYTAAPTYYLDREDTDAILAGSSTYDFNQPLIVSLYNIDPDTYEPYKTEQVFDMSSYSYTKKVYMNGEGPQAVKFNNEGGNLAIVAAGSTGVKNVSLGAGGDAVVMDEDYALQNAVNIYGGAGDDSVFVRHNANTYIDFSAGGSDILVTAGEANARVTIAGYQASTGAAIRVEEYLDVENETAGTIAEGIENGIISFDEGIVRITTDEGRSEINVGTNGAGGQIVNLMTHATSGNDYKQAVGFTGADGGVVDGSTYQSPLIMIGNSDNTDSAGSSLVGGSANDTFYAGANDIIEVGYGNDLVKLYDDETRAGAVVDIGNGRTTIEGMNNTLADSTGDVISVAIDPQDATFSLLYNDSLQAVEIESSADGYYALLTDVDTLEGNYTTQYIYDEIGEELYSVAIGTVNSTIQVTEDEDLRPNVFFGYQTAIDFRGYTGDAIIDLRGDMAESIIDETIVIIDDDITTLYAGIGDTALKGDLDDETLYAGKGNTWLYGDGGKNLLVGYEGADKEGQTVFYVLGNEDGAAHTISGFNYVDDNNYTDNKKVTADALEFDLDDNNITRIDISGSDLVIEITDKAGTDTESALLKDAIKADGTGKDFIVSDNIAQVAENHLVFDQFADYYYATGKNATVEVSGRIEDDVVLWLDEDETGKVFEGDIAVIDATNSDATAQLAGNENDNAIFAGTGETSLWGGEGGNDLLVGNAGGRDTFYYSFGNGDDTITNVKDGDVIALDVSLDQIDEIDMSDASAIRIIMNDGDVLTINDAGHDVNVMIDNGEGGTDTYSTREARSRQ